MKKMFGRFLVILFLLFMKYSFLDARKPYFPFAIHDKSKVEGAHSALDNDINLVLKLVKSQGQKIAILEDKLNVRDETVKLQEEMINELKNTVREHSDKIQELFSDVNNKNIEIKILENDVKKLRQKISRCNKACRKAERGLPSVDNNDDELMERTADDIEEETKTSHIHNREISKSNFKGSISRRAVNHVSFSVYLAHRIQHLGEHQVIKFDRIVTNDGNGYNAHTGMFTVPVAGTYMFIFYLNTADSAVKFDLMVDDVLKASGVSRPATLGQSKDVQGGGTVILNLNQGVSVWVENYYINSEVFSTSIERWVSFSGFLLY